MDTLAGVDDCDTDLYTLLLARASEREERGSMWCCLLDRMGRCGGQRAGRWNGFCFGMVMAETSR